MLCDLTNMRRREGSALEEGWVVVLVYWVMLVMGWAVVHADLRLLGLKLSWVMDFAIYKF